MSLDKKKSTDELVLSFSRLVPQAELPRRAHETDAGLDLKATESAIIGPGERCSIGTGLAVAIPPCFAGLIVPRSGTALRNGISIVNAPGLIDSDYRGELRVLLHNTDLKNPFTVAIGDRIAQLVIIPVALPTPIQVTTLPDTVRGTGGFGSSGK